MALSILFLVSSCLFVRSRAYVSTGFCRDWNPECLKESIQSVLPAFVKGSPRLGTEPLDPFVIKRLVLTLPGDLKIEFINGTSKGLRKCVIDSARMVDDTFDLQLHCNLSIKGQYRSSGRLLMFTIDGDGDSIIKIKNIKIQLLAKLASVMLEDGKKHLEIRASKVNHSFEGQVYYRMTNLMKGNPQIGAVIVDFMNSNWRMVAEEFGKPIVDFGVSNVLRNIKQALKAMPLEELIGTQRVN